MQMQALNRRFYHGIMKLTLYRVKLPLSVRLTELGNVGDQQLLRHFEWPSKMEMNCDNNYLTGFSSALRHHKFIFKSNGKSNNYVNWPCEN